MPKMKSHRALAKKVRVTRNGKVIRRTTKQNHFNARANGNARRKKRSDCILPRAESKSIRTALHV